MVLSIKTAVGARLWKSWKFADNEFVSDHQFTVQMGEDSWWRLYPATNATNPTFVDGNPVDAGGIPLRAGQIISLKGQKGFLEVGFA